MLRHFINIALRNIRRNRLLSFIQIVGLSLGITAFILIVKYVEYEKNWDAFNTNFDRIYRVQEYKKGDKLDVNTLTSFPVSGYMKNNLPEVEEVISIDTEKNRIFSSSPELTFIEQFGASASSDVFDIFSFKLIQGNKVDVLDQPNSIVLSQSMAQKFFPGKNAVGEIIYDKEKNELLVTGIMEDIPVNSHITAAYIRSIIKESDKNANEWGNTSFMTYVLLRPGALVSAVDYQIRNIYKDHLPLNKSELYLHPLKKIHLEPDGSGNSKSIVFFYSLMGVLILLLAKVNFMNLSTSMSTKRSKEIGIRKTNGSSKQKIRWQFLSESIIISVLAFIIALALTFICLPFFSTVVKREITLSVLNDAGLIILTLGIIIIAGFLAGIYPAYIAAGYNPIKMLKGQGHFPGTKRKSYGMMVMVYVQFILSTILFGSSIWMYRQVNFLENKEVGFDKEYLLHTRIPSNNSHVSYDVLRNELLSNPDIRNLSVSGNTPLHHSWNTTVFYEAGPNDELTPVQYNKACFDFINTYNFTLLKGRNFSREYTTDVNKCLVNETAVRKFGWKNAIGKWIQDGGKKYEVIGVLKDFNQGNLNTFIEPYVLLLHDGNLDQSTCFTFLVNSEKINQSKREVKNTLAGFFPNSIFNIYEFEEDSNRKVLEIWTNVRNTSGFFTILAIIIALVGIFGLVVFLTQQKIKEIGVRKVHGAKTIQMFLLTTNKLIVLLLIAILNVVPVFPILQRLTPGAYKYQATVWDVLLVAIGSILIIIISSGFLAYKAATRNPVEALRYE
ncbi:ABC transporter permease [uncultured Draconibacterium sp.]|uniref:ABC transporter permease n=1 Tax=uncultured Draconibacterium sp. TaxID=1573823 RepID=UPI003217F9DC